MAKEQVGDRWIHTNGKSYRCLDSNPLATGNTSLCGEQEQAVTAIQPTCTSDQSKIIRSVKVHTGNDGIRCKCSECDYSASNLSNLYSHVRTHHKGCTFERAQGVPKFESIPPVDKYHKCPDCEKLFNLAGKLLVHRRMKHGYVGPRAFSTDSPALFHCPECKRGFKYHKTVDVHMEKIHNKSCAKNIKKITVIKTSPEMIAQGEKTFKCSECACTENELTSVYRHMREHHKGCTIVKRGTKSRPSRLEFIPLEDKRHMCTLCGEAFSRPSHLIVHNKQNHGYVGTERLSVSDHVVAHKCPECGSRFKSSSDVNTHLKRVHDKILVYDSNENSATIVSAEDSSSPIEFDMVDYVQNIRDMTVMGQTESDQGGMEQVHGPAEKPCEYLDILKFPSCITTIRPAAYTQSAPVNETTIIKIIPFTLDNGETQYKCSLCGFSYHFRSNVYYHMRAKHKGCTIERSKKGFPTPFFEFIPVEDRSYKCPDCGKGYDVVKTLNQHRKQIHGYLGPCTTPSLLYKGLFKCPDCSCSFRHYEDMSEHVKNVHQRKLPTSTQLVYRKEKNEFIEPESKKIRVIKTSNTTEDGKAIYKCSECYRCSHAFKDYISFRNHMINVHNKKEFSDGDEKDENMECNSGTSEFCEDKLSQVIDHVSLDNARERLSQENGDICQEGSQTMLSETKDTQSAPINETTIIKIIPFTLDNGETQYKCSLCGFSYHFRSNVYYHMRAKHKGCTIERFKKGFPTPFFEFIPVEDRSYKCPDCGKGYDVVKTLNQHRKQIHGYLGPCTTPSLLYKGLFKCPDCSCSFRHYEDMSEHVKNVHQRKLLTSTQLVYRKEKHEYIEPEGKKIRVIKKSNTTEDGKTIIYKCSECNYSSLHLSNVYKHMKSSHKGCTIETFRNNDVLGSKFEFILSSEEKYHKCPECPKSYELEKTLLFHRESSHGPRKLKMKCHNSNFCYKCSHAFKDYISFRNHMINVHNKKEFSDGDENTEWNSGTSEFCEDKLSQVIDHVSLDNARECLSQENGDICQEGSQTMLSETKDTQSTLHEGNKVIRASVVVDNDKRIYTCSECYLSYTSIQTLYSHMRASHKGCTIERKREDSTKIYYEYIPVEEDHKFPDCGMVFCLETNLNQHREAKHGHEGVKTLMQTTVELHKCPDCGQSFSSHANLIRHAQTIHKVNKFPENRTVIQAEETSPELVAHVEKLYTCSACGYSRHTLRYLYRHMRLKHKGCTIEKRSLTFPRFEFIPKDHKSVNCYDEREKPFRHGGELYGHRKLKHGYIGPKSVSLRSGLLYSCSKCNRRFKNHSGVRRHLTEVHKKIDPRGIKPSHVVENVTAQSSMNGGVPSQFLCSENMAAQALATENVSEKSLDTRKVSMLPLPFHMGRGTKQNLMAGDIADPFSSVSNVIGQPLSVESDEDSDVNEDINERNAAAHIDVGNKKVVHDTFSLEAGKTYSCLPYKLPSTPSNKMLSQNAKTEPNKSLPSNNSKVISVIKIPMKDWYNCSECEFGCHCLSSLYRHMRSKHQGCTIKKFRDDPSSSRLEVIPFSKSTPELKKQTQSKIISALKNTYKCSECNFCSHLVSHIYTHMCSVHKGCTIKKLSFCNDEVYEFIPLFIDNIKCCDCGKTFSFRSGLQYHQQSQHGYVGFKKLNSENGKDFPRCSECDQAFICSSSVHKHMEAVHKHKTHPSDVTTIGNEISDAVNDLSLPVEKKDTFGVEDETMDIDERTEVNEEISGENNTKMIGEPTTSFSGHAGMKDNKLKLVNQDKDFRCEVCGYDSINESDIQVHMRVEHKGCAIDNLEDATQSKCDVSVFPDGREPFKCPDCGKGFILADLLDVHIEQEHGHVEWRTSIRNGGGNRYMKMAHGNSKSKTPNSAEDKSIKVTRSIKVIRIPSNLDGEDYRGYKCSECDYRDITESKIHKHMRQYHKGCTIVKGSPSAPTFEFILNGEKQYKYKCLECGELFKFYALLTVHFKHQHSDLWNAHKMNKSNSGSGMALPQSLYSEIVCLSDEDNESETENDQLDTEELWELDGEMYMCLECGVTFKYIMNIDKHIRQKHKPSLLHLQTLRKCNSRLPKTWNSEAIYIIKRAPELMGVDEKPYACSKCGYGSITLDEVYEHMRSEHKGVTIVKDDNSSYWCEFISKDSKHYKCPECNKAFRSYSNLFLHWKKHHLRHKVNLSSRSEQTSASISTNHVDRSLENNDVSFDESDCEVKYESTEGIKVLKILQESVNESKGVFNYKCSNCGWSSSTMSFVYNHMKSNHKGCTIVTKWLCMYIPKPGRGFKSCVYCGKMFNSFHDLDGHRRRKHVSCMINCENNSTDVDGNGSEIIKVQSEWKSEMGKQYRCSKCGFLAKNSSLIYTHMRVRHKGCTIKKIKMTDPSSSTFEFIPVEEKKVSLKVCAECGIAFHFICHLNDHIKIAHSRPMGGKHISTIIPPKIVQPQKSDKGVFDKGDKLYKCSECGYGSNFLNLIYTHMKTEHNDCLILKMKLRKKNKLLRGLSGYGKQYRCGDCSIVFNFSCNLEEHMKKAHNYSSVNPNQFKVVNTPTWSTSAGTKNFLCPHCNYSCHEISSFNRHIRNVHKDFSNSKGSVLDSEKDKVPSSQPLLAGKKKFSCSICPYTNDRHGSFNRHMETVHKNGSLGFRTYKYPYGHTPSGLQKHRWKVEKENDIQGDESCEKTIHKCLKCNYVTDLLGHLQRHINIVHEYVPKSDMDEQKRKEEDEISTVGNKVPSNEPRVAGRNKFSCSICPYTSYRKNNFNRHMKTVHGNGSLGSRKYKFPYGHTPSGLHKTRQKVEKENDIQGDESCEKTIHKCLKCNYVTDLLGHLQRHINIVHECVPKSDMDEQKRKEEDEISTVGNKVPSNELRVAGRNKFSCSICPYTSYRKNNFNRHMKTVHGNGSLDSRKYKFPYGHTPSGLHKKRQKVEKENDIQGDESCEKTIHKCLKCNYVTGLLGHLQRHVRIVHDCVSKSDPDTDEQKRKEEDGNDHVGNGTLGEGEEMYTCPKCNYATRWKDVFFRHIKAVHNDFKISKGLTILDDDDFGPKDL